jgi:hypothetical protein
MELSFSTLLKKEDEKRHPLAYGLFLLDSKISSWKIPAITEVLELGNHSFKKVVVSLYNDPEYL